MRYVYRVSKAFRSEPDKVRQHGRFELDSHADTFVAGKNCTLLNYTERVCDVLPYSDEYEAKSGVPIVTVATGYTNSHGRQYILVIHEALWMPDMAHSLANPNQLRHNGVEVNDNPYSGQPMVIRHDEEEFVACLRTQGTNIFINTWSPTSKDLRELPHITLTSSEIWEPNDVQFPTVMQSEVEDVEAANVRSVQVQSYGDFPRQIFDIRAINRRIMGTLKVPTLITDGPIDADQLMPARTFISSKRHTNTTAEDLSEVWGISVQQAQMTLDASTQNHVRSAIMPLSRRYRVDRMFEPLRLRCEVATDTMHMRSVGLHGDRYCQVFGTKFMFAEAYPIQKKSDCHESLRTFMREYGAPSLMISDGASEQTGRNSKFQSLLRKYHVPNKVSQPSRPNQNPCEMVIRELRKRWYRTMFRTNCPISLWQYGVPYIAKLMQHTATNAAGLEGRTPIEMVTGHTPDISQYLDFGWFDWVWYRDNAGYGEAKLGRFLGIASEMANIMTYHILGQHGSVLSSGTVSRVTELEKKTESTAEKMKEFSNLIANQFNEPRLVSTSEKPDLTLWGDLLEDDSDFAAEFNRLYDNGDVREADDEFSPDSFDAYLNMELAIDRGGENPEFARVTKRLKDKNGLPIGTANDNPILDTRMYEVEYHDGHRQALSANIIAQNMFAQVDGNGHRQLLMDSIIDTRTDGSQVLRGDEFVQSSNGVKRRRETTKGWEVLVQWKDGSTTWSKLKDVKDSYPVELAEYAVQNGIQDEPAFAWWVPYTIKKKARIVAKIKSKYWQRTHKYGIRIPKTVLEAKQLDKENGNTLWWDALMKEMKNVRPAFQIHEGDPKDLVGFTPIKCHIVWDVKLGENFRRKARLVAGGHMTDAPSTITYSSVVSRDSVRIALTIAALNGLDVLACDIQNAYLSADCREKCYTVAGAEFGSDAGKTMIIKKALYGLKSSGAAFHSMLAGVLWDLQFRPSKGDPDVWLKPNVKPNGAKYYDMVLCYVDDVISIGEAPRVAIDGIEAVFKLKGDKAEVPDMYLGGELKQVRNESGNDCWTFSSEKYIRTAVANVEEKLAKSGLRLPTKCVTPVTSGYHPSEDTSDELDKNGLQYYQELIGVLRWAVELGRADILLEVSLLSSHLALPRSGHLQQVYHIFGYLKESPRRRLYFDSDHPKISEGRFQRFEWEDFYKDAKEEIPLDMPEPRGKEVSIHCFVDASHASDKVTRRSQTGILIFVNRAPIIFYSKKQNSVETSTFGSEFTAMKQAVELIKGLRYKLRMFGVPLDGPANVYCDNEAVYKNVAIPDSTLNKKMHSISYHFCREAVAAGIIRIAKENTKTNLADLFTKILAKPRRDELIDKFMY